VAGDETAGTCRQCSKPTSAAKTGRPRQYCSPACRQAAYRARQDGDHSAAQARLLAGTLASAIRELVRAVTSQAADTPARQAAAGQAAIALAELAALAGAPLPAGDETPEAVTERETAAAAATPAVASPASARRPPVTAWTRSADRSTWVADAGDVTLAVTRQTGGGWRPGVHRPGAPDVNGPATRTRTAAQQWAEQYYGSDETEEGSDETMPTAATAPRRRR
jgi:hypothetical protein